MRAAILLKTPQLNPCMQPPIDSHEKTNSVLGGHVPYGLLPSRLDSLPWGPLGLQPAVLPGLVSLITSPISPLPPQIEHSPVHDTCADVCICYLHWLDAASTGVCW